MEDRINSGLLFVMIDRATDRARSEWDERLRALPGVARISWWKNVQLNRRDWLGELRTMEDFEILGICEIDDVIDPPIVSGGARALVFRRYPRPSQGVLRLPTLGLSVVMISTRNLEDEAAVVFWVTTTWTLPHWPACALIPVSFRVTALAAGVAVARLATRTAASPVTGTASAYTLRVAVMIFRIVGAPEGRRAWGEREPRAEVSGPSMRSR